MAANVQETNYHLSLVPLIAINSKDAKACIASAVNRSFYTSDSVRSITDPNWDSTRTVNLY